MTNEYGLDVDYFKKKLELILRDVGNYTPDEMYRELSRLADVTGTDETNLQLNLKIMELEAENKKLGETNEQLGNYYMKINSMYWNDEIFHGEGFYTVEFVEMVVDL